MLKKYYYIILENKIMKCLRNVRFAVRRTKYSSINAIIASKSGVILATGKWIGWLTSKCDFKPVHTAVSCFFGT